MLGKSLSSWFLMLFRCPPNLDFLALASTGARFLHFPQVVFDIDFRLQKPLKIEPKTVPRRAQEGPKTMSNCLWNFDAFRKGQKIEKSSFRKFRRPTLAQPGSQERPQEASKNDQKSINNRLPFEPAPNGASGTPKTLQKWCQNGLTSCQHRLQVLMFFAWKLR